ncbi:MAG: hypothetical protein ACR2NF_07345, partial [Pirellulales bacterium]
MNKSNSSREYVPPKFFSLCEGQVLTEQNIDCYEATKAVFQQSKNWQKKVETIQVDRDDCSTKKISWPSEKIFGACLTHDVDNVAKYRCVMHGRRLRGQIKSYFKGYERRALAGIKSSFLGICDSVVKQG